MGSLFHICAILKISLVVICIMPIVECAERKTVRRKARALPIIFPRTSPTRIQWIVGIGIPLENLAFEAMTTGYVIKVEYWLPYLASQLRTKTQMKIDPRKLPKAANMQHNLLENTATDTDTNETIPTYFDASNKALSNYRWAVYKGLEKLADNLGMPGRVCMLKSICEAAEVPFHYKNGVLAELFHILLTPSSSVDELSRHADNAYFQAESLGNSGANCNQVYASCTRSLLDQLTDIHAIAETMKHAVG